jgi:hypothetical protein
VIRGLKIRHFDRLVQVWHSAKARRTPAPKGEYIRSSLGFVAFNQNNFEKAPNSKLSSSVEIIDKTCVKFKT